MALEESLNLPSDGGISEFIEQNRRPDSKKAVKKEGGPYSKLERDKRMQEVYKLHFEYGYSARKISELMKVNRNTINGDINYWYSKIFRNYNIFNPEEVIILNIERLEIQRSRLREQLDKTKSFQEKLALERMVYDIDCKVLYTYTRMTESSRKVWDLATMKLNKWMKDNKKEERYMTLFDKLSVSEKAAEKIDKIIKEDRLHRSF
ncbi:MAG: hypothetical protein KGH89_01390 [Thaumarchaeota archaeon]|nr:hypothetical protein [Nitrososphaerota archaeon]